MTSCVLVATDFSPASDYAVHVAAENARRGAAELHVLHVLLADEAARIGEAQARLHALQRALEARLHEAAPPVRVHLRVGPHADTIAEVARSLSADLVVVGTHSQHGSLRAKLGSVAEAVIRTAPCTVVVARAK